MKTMFPPGFYQTGFVATHLLGHIAFMIAYILRPSRFCEL